MHLFTTIISLLLQWNLCRMLSVCYPSFLNGKCFITVQSKFWSQLLVAPSVGRRRKNPEYIRRRVGVFGIICYLTLFPLSFYLCIVEGYFAMGLQPGWKGLDKPNLLYCILWLGVILIGAIDLMIGEWRANHRKH